MLQSACETILKYGLISKGDSIVLGVSGGADSVALLDILCDMSYEYDLKLYVVHVNHGLRGKDADNDQQYVETFCRERNVPCRIFKFDVAEIARKEHLTSEEAGRKMRYCAFETVANEVHANKIATAHHMNDNTETLLFNLLRGSGLTGLCGIRPMRDKYIRPLIKTSRTEIEKYLSEKNISWCTDSTNNETVFTRNKIRHELLPYIKNNFNPSAEHALQRMSELCGDDNDFIDGTAKKCLSDCTVSYDNTCIVLHKENFNLQHIAIKRRMIRHILEKLSVPLKDVHMVHVDGCIKMIECSGSGAYTHVGGCRVSIEQNGIHFSTKNVCDDFEVLADIDSECYIPQIESRIIIKQVGERGASSKNRVYISADKISSPLVVRNRRNGDRIKPFGMSGEKKLKDYFIDKKVPLSERNNIPVFVHNNKIVWVGGYCINEDCRVTSDTDKILMLEIISDEV